MCSNSSENQQPGVARAPPWERGGAKHTEVQVCCRMNNKQMPGPSLMRPTPGETFSFSKSWDTSSSDETFFPTQSSGHSAAILRLATLEGPCTGHQVFGMWYLEAWAQTGEEPKNEESGGRRPLPPVFQLTAPGTTERERESSLLTTYWSESTKSS